MKPMFASTDLVIASLRPMIPYIEQPALSVGPITVHAFGAILATAVLVGLEVGRRRLHRLGLDARVGDGLMWYAVVGGFLGAHLFSVLFYFPEKVAHHPLMLFKLWEDVSSFGGILGGLVGVWFYFLLEASVVGCAAKWEYVEVVAFAFPIALAVGRIACSIAHDHPGTVTTFPLAVSLASPAARAYIGGVYRSAGRLDELPTDAVLARLGFHDLGWYEFLYLGLVVVPAFLLIDRMTRDGRRPGTFLAAFVVFYLPVRFAFDFLRVNDVRYAGLTPAQWACASIVFAFPVVWLKLRPPVQPQFNGGG